MSDCEIWEGDNSVLGYDLPAPINCVITDPPYGMAFRSKVAEMPEGKQYTQEIEGDMTPEEAILTFRRAMRPILPKMADTAEMYIFTAWHVLDEWIPLVKRIPDFTLKQMIVWEKGYPGLGDLECNWGCGHEIILYLKKGRRPIPKRRSAVLHIDRVPAKQNIHPTEKPVDLLKILIEMSTDPGDLIVDPFAGSGSTVLAAQQLGRRCVGIELDPRWVPRARERLRQTGFGF